MVKIIHSMGYRRLSDNIYSKPVGYHVYIIKINELEISYIFIGKDNKLHTWSTKILDNCDLLNSIKSYENYNRRTYCDNIAEIPSFDFLTRLEELEDLI